MNLQFRPKIQCFMQDRVVKSWHCIQVRNPNVRGWTFLSDEEGILKFETATERDAYMQNIEKLQAGGKLQFVE